MGRFDTVNSDVSQNIQRIDAPRILLLCSIPQKIRCYGSQSTNVKGIENVLSGLLHNENHNPAEFFLINAEHAADWAIPPTQEKGQSVESSIASSDRSEQSLR